MYTQKEKPCPLSYHDRSSAIIHPLNIPLHIIPPIRQDPIRSHHSKDRKSILTSLCTRSVLAEQILSSVEANQVCRQVDP
ncbi:hypothetical protein VTL71DRAFT_2554 [Oculimacula yallundae]|uniref:Uncharacterized protein n=1 Tax=Oculimacula yallundae TaxID=86028 RepID=A0ABR4C966_9HELO